MAQHLSIARFRVGMSRLAGAVSIVATGSAAGRTAWRGMTATAVCSLCAEPPSLVACLNRVTGTYEQLQQTGVFSVNVLSSRQVGLARTFAGLDGLVGAARFAAAAWTVGALAVPVLEDALASFECRTPKVVEYGTHAMLIGLIETARWTDCDGEPLVYHQHRFHDLGGEVGVTGGAGA